MRNWKLTYHFQSLKRFLVNTCLEVLYPKLQEKFKYPVKFALFKCCHFILWLILFCCFSVIFFWREYNIDWHYLATFNKSLIVLPIVFSYISTKICSAAPIRQLIRLGRTKITWGSRNHRHGEAGQVGWRVLREGGKWNSICLHNKVVIFPWH